MENPKQKSVSLTPSSDAALLIPLLREADEDEQLIASSIEHPANIAYLASSDQGGTIGATMVHWDAAESEIIYLAVDASHRNQGYGKAIITAILSEGRSRGIQSMIVGTASTSVENIIFYQKCGFRMDFVRKNYFDYFPQPVYEHGIRLRDMIVFRYELSQKSA